ncbi:MULTISPECIES: hypothetical protein [Paenibacillus]|uniref:hypothetical protein n=1 Tax=Paenibacillus TaxID=44249 RepID=UPI0004679E71|nr:MULTISPECIES: hypothetical protein [Paenibacillus]KGP77452.1 hypothetical protein P364_0133045 [Paenibacillus sp. MAEPY2]KGP78137.1 hypothetical protein P363_0132485 [Paenibacillus sp. MAEPY1]OZQ59787.1 hypothetical protein CA599_30960 [Paenibacillus taichungensis]
MEKVVGVTAKLILKISFIASNTTSSISSTILTDLEHLAVFRKISFEISSLKEGAFQAATCILVTLHPYALFNDPERSYNDLYRAEGGIVFKDAQVTFSINSVRLKESELKLRQQRLLYPVLMAEVIKELASEYSLTDGINIKDKIIKAGWKLVADRITKEAYLKEMDSRNASYREWPGLNDLIHNEIKPVIYGKWNESMMPKNY